MPAAAVRTAQQRRLAWLLWLALLLPFAQLAAGVHELSHLRAGPASDESTAGQRALHLQAPCELCLSAAVVAGGAPLPQVQPPALLATVEALPSVFSLHPHAVPFALAYRSHAPPLARV